MGNFRHLKDISGFMVRVMKSNGLKSSSKIEGTFLLQNVVGQHVPVTGGTSGFLDGALGTFFSGTTSLVTSGTGKILVVL